MSKLKELIKQLCPDGVEYRKVGEVLRVLNGYKTIKKDDILEIGKYPVIDQSKKFVAGYSDDSSLLMPNGEYIIFGDHTREIKYINFQFIPGDSGVKILSSNNKEILNRFIYHCLRNLKIENRGYNRHWIVLSPMEIPIPPLEVQEEIVRILDSFTMLEAELEAELEKRKIQYTFWRDKLLDRKENIEVKQLSEVVRIKNGKDYKHLNEGDYPVFGSGGIMTYVSDFCYDKPSVLIPRKGSLKNIFYVDKPFWNVDTIFYTEINEEIILPRYLYHYLQNYHLEELNTAGGVPSLTQNVLNKIKISVPSLEIQERIVEVLDNFDKICESLSIGLPAEIEKRG